MLELDVAGQLLAERPGRLDVVPEVRRIVIHGQRVKLAGESIRKVKGDLTKAQKTTK
jgi:hypothetical protein